MHQSTCTRVSDSDVALPCLARAGVSQIFVLARGKRGVSAQERVDRMIATSPLFQRVRKAGPHLAAKVG
jgi:hypothetical protein